MTKASHKLTRLILAIILLMLIIAPSALAQQGKSAEDDYLYAKRLIDEGYFDLAAEQLEKILKDSPDFSEADEAQFLLGDSYLKADNPKLARAAFLRVAIIYPQSPRAPEALFNVGIALKQMGEAGEAADAFKRVNKFYPESPLATQGLTESMRLSLLIGDTTQAEIAADALAQHHGRSTAADEARLFLAKRLCQRGDVNNSLLYLKRITERSEADSIAAEALIEIGRIQRSRWLLQDAEENFLAAMNKDSSGFAGGLARIELARLYIEQRLLDQALKTLEPLVANSASPFFDEAELLTGDALYLKVKLTKAFNHYQSSKASEAKLRAAWTAERAGSPQKALQIYSDLYNSDSSDKMISGIRAAELNANLGHSAKATALWVELLVLNTDDPFARLRYTAATHFATDKTPAAHAVFQKIFKQIESSGEVLPFSDDIEYLYSVYQERLENFDQAAVYYRRIMSKYPASEYVKESNDNLEFLQHNKLRSNRLVERMAELSSRPQGSVKAVTWSLDWGDFYLKDFKDPVKAVDQYDTILDDVLATTDERVHAFRNSLDAYLCLYETAIREQDTVAVGLYGDSVHAKLDYFEKLTSFSDDAMLLHVRTNNADYLWHSDDSEVIQAILDDGWQVVNRYREEKLPPAWTARLIRNIIDFGEPDSTFIQDALRISEHVTTLTSDERFQAAHQANMVRLLSHTGHSDSAVRTALRIVNNFSNTPSAVEMIWWLQDQDNISDSDKLTQLDNLLDQSPYAINAAQYYRQRAQLLDKLNKPLESLASEKRAYQIYSWNIPQFDFLETPNISARLREAKAYFAVDSLTRAKFGFESVLNADNKGEYAASALYFLSLIYSQLGLLDDALSSISTLQEEFPYSEEAILASHNLAQLTFLKEQYSESEAAFLELLKSTSEEDSALYFSEMATVCLYRQDKLTAAKESAKNLYQRFKDRDDLDEVKARFYLEKGMSYDRMMNFDEARSQYETVLKSFKFTSWADDAKLAIGSSYIKENKFEDGIPILEQLREDYPNSDLIPDVQLSLGLAFARLEKYSEAVAALRQAWSDTSSRRAWLPAFASLADLYRRLNFTDALTRLNREYISRYPNAEDAIDRRMEIAQMFLQNRQWEDAVRQYRPLLPLADAEREAEIQFYIGEAYTGLGDYRTAILEYLKVPILGRKTKLDWGLTALYQSGNCYEKLGDSKGAERMYLQIIKQTGEASNYGRAARKKIDELQEQSN